MEYLQEFLQKIIEESISKDEKYNDINNKILQLEKEIMPTLPAETKRLFFQIDALNHELMDYIIKIATGNITINLR